MVTEPHGHGDNDTNSLLGSTIRDRVQSTGVHSVAAYDNASYDAGESVINVGKDTSNRINENVSPSVIGVTLSRSTQLQLEQKQKGDDEKKGGKIVVAHHQVIQLTLH